MGANGQFMGLKVMILAPGEIFGGVERQILDVCSRSSESGGLRFVPHLFYDTGLDANLRDRGVGAVHVPSRQRYDPAAAAHVARLAHDGGFGVIHAHGYRAVVTLAVAASRGLPLPPVVKTEHGLPEPAQGNPVTAAKIWLNHRLDRWATRKIDATVCYVTEDIRRHFDAAHDGLARHMVPNGIAALDPEDYPRPEDLPTEGLNLGIVGRVSEVKGIDYALRAMASEAMPDLVRFVVIGTGSRLEPLRDRALRAGLANRVIFLGFRRNIYDYLAHLDALLMPSLHEGLPYTLLEAMSLGRPILASSVGGLAEVLQDGETGLLFPPRDPDAIAAACRLLHGEPGLGPRLGRNAARRQREQYTLDGMIERYVEIYREAIASRPASQA
jgi:glycosyltransferase involved in cell wall biosynthesis